jgi:hypothetical protein
MFVGAMSLARVFVVAEDRRSCLTVGSGRVGKSALGTAVTRQR